MTTRQVNLTRYNRSTSGIVDGQTVYAAHQINNYTPIETALDETQPYVEAHEKSIAGIERRSFIRQFDDDQVTTGTNSITINGGSWLVLCEVDNSGLVTERTGWANSGSINVTGISSGVVWGIYPGFTYAATSNNPASKPANAYRLLTFTNNAGVVTVNRKSWQNSIDSDNRIFEGSAVFNNSITALGGVTGFLPANYHDIQAEWVSASQIKILAGSRCRSNDNTVDIVFSSDYTIDMTNATPTSTTGGRTVAESANTFYYFYVGLDSNNLPLGWIDTANLAGGGSVTNPAAYSKGRRQLKLAISNNASSDILPFAYLDNNYVRYLNLWRITGGAGVGNPTQGDTPLITLGTATAFTTVNGGVFIPPISRSVQLGVAITDNYSGISLRATGTTHIQSVFHHSNGRSEIRQAVNASQQFDYMHNYYGTLAKVSIEVAGYYVTEVK